MDITIRQGETLQLPIENDDESAISVQFQAALDNVIYIDETENFVDGKATIITNDTNHPLGDYEYMLTVIYEDGVVDKLPDPANCVDDDCALPTLTICQGNLLGVS